MSKLKSSFDEDELERLVEKLERDVDRQREWARTVLKPRAVDKRSEKENRNASAG